MTKWFDLHPAAKTQHLVACDRYSEYKYVLCGQQRAVFVYKADPENPRCRKCLIALRAEIRRLSRLLEGGEV